MKNGRCNGSRWTSSYTIHLSLEKWYFEDLVQEMDRGRLEPKELKELLLSQPELKKEFIGA